MGFEGWYEVSNLGRVKRVKTSTGKPSGRVLKSRPNAKDYRFVSLCVLGKVCGRMVHRLVAQAFIPNPDNLPEVNHKKALKHGGSNVSSNLEWTTSKGNKIHAVVNGLMTTGEECPWSGLTQEQVSEVRERYAAGGITQRALAQEYASLAESLTLTLGGLRASRTQNTIDKKLTGFTPGFPHLYFKRPLAQH